jgi:hypothetical protein
MTVPYAFGSATTSIPLSELDVNFNTPITLGNTAIQLGNTVTTLNNMTLANATVSSGNVTVTSASLSGNLTFTGTGNRITGDFSNATIANRVMFQTSTVNGATRLHAIPNGTGVVSAIAAINNSDPNNASFMQVSVNAAEAQLISTLAGTGTYLPMTFYTGGSERMRVDTSGRVGIGTSSPATGVCLDVFGGYARLRSNTTINADISGNINALVFESSGGTGEHAIIAGGNTSNNILTFYTTAAAAPAERMRIDSSGNVGIGTTSPSTRLTVSSSGANGLDLAVDQGNAVASARLFFTNGTAGQGYSISNDTGSLKFNRAATAGSSTGTESMRIDSSGNVGIGTSSPISVAKTSIKQAAGGGTGSTQLHLEQSNATDGYGLKCDSADGALAFSRYSSGSYTERARIASNGDFTIASTTLYITNIPTTATAGNCLISAGEGNKFYRSTSSLKYKRNVVDMQRGIADVQQLRPVNFNGVSDFDGNKLFAGFIAEEVEALNFKEFVIYDENGEPDGLQYANMVALLTKAIQEQQQMIETLQAEVAALKGA